MIEINGNNLTIETVVNVARFDEKVKLSKDAIARIIYSRKCVNKLIDNNQIVYGITTGFGSLANVSVSYNDLETLQENLIRSHAVGVGEPFSEEVVRAIMLLRINTFANGFSGIKLETVNTLIEMLNKKVYPFIPSKGSVGSSGDLAPLSHLILVMMGEGLAIEKGEIVSGQSILQKRKIKPVKLGAKEGLALNNGTPVMSAIGTFAVYDAINLLKNSIASSLIAIEALCSNTEFLYQGIHDARPHPGQKKVAKILRNLVKNSELVNSKSNVQEAYSIRATPVVLGASLDAIEYIKNKVEIEINSATDNPLIFSEKAYSGANFHGQPIAISMDFLKIAVSEIGNIAERRIARLLDPNLNHGLPAFLIENSGLNSGFMIPQYTCASLVSENKVLSHPASVDSIPTSNNQEDHVSMGTTAARQAYEILKNVQYIIAIEFMIACQAVEMRDKNPSISSQNIIRIIRNKVQRLKKDRYMHSDIINITEMVRNNLLIKDLEELK